MNRHEKQAQSHRDAQEKRAAVIVECQHRWKRGLNCKGCRFFHYPLFPVVGEEHKQDNKERCSQWDIVHDWRAKQQRTLGVYE